MGSQHYTQDMSKIPLKYHKNVLFYTKYTHPTLICRGTDAWTDARTDAHTENIYSIFRDKLLLLGEHGFYYYSCFRRIAHTPSKMVAKTASIIDGGRPYYTNRSIRY
jgi:hypothetical protein